MQLSQSAVRLCIFSRYRIHDYQKENGKGKGKGIYIYRYICYSIAAAILILACIQHVQ